MPEVVFALFVKSSQDISYSILTRRIDIHPPQGSTHQVVVSTALPVTLALIQDGVRWRRIVPTEAFPSILDPGISVALVHLATSSDALSWSVVLGLSQVLRKKARIPVLNTLPIPGGAGS